MSYSKSLFIIFSLSLIFSSCKEDSPVVTDTTTEMNNQVEFNGNIHEITWGKLEYFGTEDGRFYSGLSLYSKDVQYDATNNEQSGKGNEFYFDDIISGSNNIVGKYLMVSENATLESAGQVWEADLYINYDYDQHINGDTYYFWEEGRELEINFSNNEFEVIFNGKDDRGVNVKVYYKGTLVEVDVSCGGNLCG